LTVAVIGRLAVRRLRATCSGGPGSVLVELSVVEQRYRAVLAVLAGDSVTSVAAQLGVSRQTLHKWLARYRNDGLAGLIDRPKRPLSCPWQSSVEVESAVCEMRREHPRWGPRRLAFELGRDGMAPVPSRMTVYRILVRHGLIDVRRRGRRRQDYTRWERDAPMALWQLDIVGGVFLADGTEVKVVTGVDDHSRYCVIAAACRRATGRAVCVAFARALERFGPPAEVLTDNGKQFTDRFGKGGEVLFDRICRDNGIVHRLTQPASPTTTGKIERFHQTLRRDLLADHEPFGDVEAVQATLDRWVAEDYNTRRPHQSLGMASPAERFAPVPDDERATLPLRLPAALTAAPAPPATEPEPAAPERVLPLPPPATPGAVEFDRVVPPSGNMSVAGKQFWLGPDRAGITITFWADHDVIHLTAGGARLKTVRSHLSDNDLARLAATGGRPAGPPPLPPPDTNGAAVEVDRVVSRAGTVSLGGRVVLAAEILGGRRVTIRIDDTALVFFDPETRELLRTRPSPYSYTQARRFRGARPAGPPPRPSLEPVRVQRRASNTGVIMVVGQKVALGRIHAHTTVTVYVAETTLTIETTGGDVRTVARTTTQPVRSFKAARPRKAGPMRPRPDIASVRPIGQG
jgi:transposase InsO family protein